MLKNFQWSAFDSPDAPGSGRSQMDREFINMLEDARAHAQVPFVITSGYRTPEYNAQIGGVEDSAHTHGTAADIQIQPDWSRGTINWVIACLVDAGFDRIGEAQEFIHADCDDRKPAPAFFDYFDGERHKA